MALIILDPVRVVRNETDGLLYFAATYRLTEAIGGVDSGEFFVEIAAMSDSEVVAALQSAAAAHANLGTGGVAAFVPADVRVGIYYGGLSINSADSLLGSEPDGVAIDFIDRSMIIRDTVTPVNVYNGLPTAKLSMTRASMGYYCNSAGLLMSAAINEARYDYYPDTLLPRGMLLEEARTNLCLQSEVLGTTWTASNITVGANTGLGARGTMTADKLTATAANGTLKQAIACSNVDYTFSIWLRRITGVGNVDISADGTTWVTVPVTTVLARFETTLNLSNATYNPGIRIVVSGDEVEAWGGQMEAGGCASSYIPTTTIAVTRAADVTILTGSLFPLSQTAGTLILEGEYAGNVTAAGVANQAGLITVGDGTVNERNKLVLSNSNTSSNWNCVDGGSSSCNISITGMVINTVYKIGGVYALNDFQHARDGVQGTPDVSGTLPTTTNLYIGGSAGTAFNVAHYRQIIYIPRRVTNTELEVLTT